MADVNEVLTHLGYNLHTSVIIVAEGYNELALFGELINDDVDSMMRTLSRRTFPPVLGQADVAFPVRAATNMQTLGYWVRKQDRIGGTPAPVDFTVLVMNL
jgi:hypothetical protein